MKIEVKEKSPIQKALVIEVEPKRYEKVFDRVVRQVGREISVPGFRKGKAPKSTIIRRVGIDNLKKDFLEQLIPDVAAEALKEKNIFPLSTPQCTNHREIKLEIGQPVSFELVFEVKPEIEIKDYKGIELIRIVRDIKPEDIVEQRIKEIQENMGSLIAIEEERPLQMGDVALVDFESFKSDGTLVEGGSAKDYYMTLEEKNFIPGFIPNLVGKNAGEEFEFDVDFPEDYPNEEMKGENIHFKIKLHSIMKKELPERDDELAKSAGDYESFEALKNEIEEQVKESIEIQQKKEMQEQAITKLVSQLDKVMIPEALIKAHVDRMVQSMSQQFASAGKSIEEYLKEINSNMAAFRQSLRPKATHLAKGELILDKIAQLEKVEVTDEDIKKEIEFYAKRLKQPVEVIRKNMEKSGFISSMKYELTGRKVFDILIDNANISEKTPAEVKESLDAEEGEKLEKIKENDGKSEVNKFFKDLEDKKKEDQKSKDNDIENDNVVEEES